MINFPGKYYYLKMDSLSSLGIPELVETCAPSTSTTPQTKEKEAYQPPKTKRKNAKQGKVHCERRPSTSMSSNIKERRAASQHKSVVKRGEIQELVDYNSPELAYHEMHLCPFSKNHEVGDDFQLISLAGKALPTLALCKQCKKVLVRYNKSTNSLRLHHERHGEKKIKAISKKTCTAKKSKKSEFKDLEAMSKEISHTIDEIVAHNSQNLDDLKY